MSKSSVRTNTFERKIYDLCDGKTTSLEICKITGKSSEYVGTVLSRLRKKNQISIITDKKTKRKMPIKNNNLAQNKIL